MGADIKLAFDILAFTSVMVLIVLGLGVIASMMGIFNFAHGEFVLLGAYTVYLFHERALPLWLGIVAAPFVLALVGFVLERAVIRQFYTNPIMAMLGTFAIGLVVREIIRGLLGGHYKVDSRAGLWHGLRRRPRFLDLAHVNYLHDDRCHAGELDVPCPHLDGPAHTRGP